MEITKPARAPIVKGFLPAPDVHVGVHVGASKRMNCVSEPPDEEAGATLDRHGRGLLTDQLVELPHERGCTFVAHVEEAVKVRQDQDAAHWAWKEASRHDIAG